MLRRCMFALLLAAPALSALAQSTVSITIDTESGRAPISPYVYGTNGQVYPHMTAMRSGGNRLTGYNWETNASNAGADWYHSSDNYLTWILNPPAADENEPGLVFTRFQDDALARNAYSLITLQMAGFVANDKSGTVDETQTAPSTRWAEMIHRKPGGAFTLTPDLTDGVVYSDEALNLLVTRYGPASSGTGVRGYALDNEPALWFSTHPRIHPEKVGVQELLDRSIALSSTVKDMDPSAEVFGPALYGFWAYVTLQDAPDWNVFSGQYNRFIEAYLDHMRLASSQAGRRLLDVLDVHWYPEPAGVYAGDTDPGAVERRIQAPRSLWDPTYTEDSWIGQWYSPIAIIPYLNGAISSYYPGTKLAITEYDYGAAGHISGGIAQADALGIFGKQGVYFASKWGEVADYVRAAYELYRNYDGQGGAYGDLRVSASTSDHGLSSVYAAAESGDPNRLHVVLINKQAGASLQANLALSSPLAFETGDTWVLDGSAPSIRQGSPVGSIADNTFAITLPPHSVYHLVLTASGGNRPPTVAITAPAAGGTFPEGDPVSITADASDPDGSVIQVAFFVDDSPIEDCVDTTEPYECTWTPAGIGSHTLTARATDNEGASTTSTEVPIEVQPAGTVTVTFRDGAQGYVGTRDTYLNGGGGKKNKNLNYGGSSTLRLGSIYRTLLSWDLSNIPPGSTVLAASIQMNVTEGSTSTYSLYELKRPWIEAEATWNEFAAGQGWQTAGADGSGDRGFVALGTFAGAGVGTANVPLQADGLALVQRWINTPSSNSGFLMAVDAGTDGLTFSSSEDGSVPNRPALFLTYTTDGSSNLPPTAAITADPATGPAPLTVAFDATGSSDPDGWVESYAWDFGDGSSSTEAAPVHVFGVPGAYTVRLVVTDNEGATGSAARTITAEASTSDPVTVSFFGPDDAGLDSANPTSNLGANMTLQAGVSPDQAAVMRWDVSSIPPGSTIESADVSLQVTDGSRVVYSLFALKRGWVEGEVTWNLAANGTPWQAPGANGANDREMTDLGSVRANKAGPRSIGLNQAGLDRVAAWVADPGVNYGLVLMNGGRAASDPLVFLSGESADPVDHPTLTVRYRPPASAAAKQAENASSGSGTPNALTDGLAIESVYPNPFNPTTTLRFTAPAAGRYMVSVFNALGQRVFEGDVLAAGAGLQQVRISLAGFSTGMYLARVHQAGTPHAVHAKLVLSM